MRFTLRPVDWAAIGFSALAVVFLALWTAVHSDNAWVDQWAPNLSVEVASIAATILIVDRIVRRHERQQMEPRLDGAYDRIGSALGSFVDAVADDLERARPLTEQPRRTRSVSRSSPVLDEWLRRLATEDAERPPPLAKDGLPLLAHRVSHLAEELASIAGRDREVLPPDLVAAIDGFEVRAGAMRGGYLLLKDPAYWTKHLPRQMNPLVDVIQSSGVVVSVFRTHAEDHWQKAEELRRYGREMMQRFRQEGPGSRKPAPRRRPPRPS